MSTKGMDSLINNSVSLSQEKILECPLLNRLTRRERVSVVSLAITRRPNGHYSAIYITDMDEVFGIGENGWDCNILAMEGAYWRCDKVDRPVKIRKLSNRRVCRVFFGGVVAAALDVHGQLRWWGVDRTWCVPPELVLPQIGGWTGSFLAVSCGHSLLAALNTTGELFVFGPRSYPLYKREIPSEILNFSCGYDHIALCTSDGTVFTSGSGTRGQRGYATWSQCHDTMDHYSKVRRVEIEDHCVSVSCGFYSTLCLTASGELWVCGANSNSYGYMGVQTNQPFIKVPVKITNLPKVLKLRCYWLTNNYTRYKIQTEDGCFMLGESGKISPSSENETTEEMITLHDAIIDAHRTETPSGPLVLSSSIKEKIDVIRILSKEIEKDIDTLHAIANYERSSRLPSVQNIDLSTLCDWDLLKALTGKVHCKIRSFVVFEPCPQNSKGATTGPESPLSILYWTYDNKTYGYGRNTRSYNLLGLAGTEFRAEYLYTPAEVEGLSDVEIVTVSIGEHIGAALDVESKLYWWGNCTELDIMPAHLITKNPKMLFTSVVCGSNFLATIDNLQHVRVWGKMAPGRIWYNDKRIRGHERFVSLSAGLFHLIMLSSEGEVYSYGSNDCGQRGYQPQDSEAEFGLVKQMPLNQVCKAIACGMNSTLCLTSSGDLWMCGGNPVSYGAKSHLDDPQLKFSLSKLPLDRKISAIKVSWCSRNGEYQSIYEATATTGERYVWDDSSPPRLSETPQSVFIGSVSPRGEVFNVSGPPFRGGFVECDCEKSLEIKRITESVQRKLDAISEIVNEILHDLEVVEEKKDASAEAQLLEALTKLQDLQKPKATISLSAGDGYISEEMLKNVD